MSARPPKPELPVITLTLEQQKLAELRKEMAAKHAAIMQKFKEDMEALGATVPKCTNHVWVLPEDAEWQWWGEWVIERTMRCGICDYHGGWFCPDSPIRMCEYNNDDECYYCGQPDERK